MTRWLWQLQWLRNYANYDDFDHYDDYEDYDYYDDYDNDYDDYHAWHGEAIMIFWSNTAINAEFKSEEEGLALQYFSSRIRIVILRSSFWLVVQYAISKWLLKRKCHTSGLDLNLYGRGIGKTRTQDCSVFIDFKADLSMVHALGGYHSEMEVQYYHHRYLVCSLRFFGAK